MSEAQIKSGPSVAETRGKVKQLRKKCGASDAAILNCVRLPNETVQELGSFSNNWKTERRSR